MGLRISPRKPQGFFWLDRVPDRFLTRRCGVCSIFDCSNVLNFHRPPLQWQCHVSFVFPPVGRASRAPVPSFSSYTPFRILSPLLTATKVVVYTGSPGDSRRQTLLFDLFFDTTRNLPPQSHHKNFPRCARPGLCGVTEILMKKMWRN